MGVKLKNILSEIATSVKAITLDDRISFRFLHSEFNSRLEFYFRLESKTMEIFRLFHEWTPIDIIEFIDVPTNSVGYYDSCNSLKRSKNKIPSYFNSVFGPTFKLFDVTGFTEFRLINRAQYQSEINKQYKSKTPIYWIQDGYIYIPNSSIEEASGYILEKIDENISQNEKCNLILEREVNYPQYLIDIVKKELKQDLGGIYKRIVEDEKPDNNTNNKA